MVGVLVMMADSKPYFNQSKDAGWVFNAMVEVCCSYQIHSCRYRAVAKSPGTLTTSRPKLDQEAVINMFFERKVTQASLEHWRPGD